jgi:hypothetical protein
MLEVRPFVPILLPLLAACILCPIARAQTNSTTDFGFNRIVHGWTNYSTAFTATHDAGEYATVASLFTPAIDVRPTEFGVIVIWYGTGGQRLSFANFTYRVSVWSSLDAFISNPRQGDLAAFNFAAPTGGSTTVPDATTRGGRPAYLLRFNLASTPLALTQCHEYAIGFAAIATASQAGELLVPTAAHEGPSDVQAGNLVPFGWIYLINAGGQTIYSGQLATELKIDPLGELPQLTVVPSGTDLNLLWPASAACYGLEACDGISASAVWTPVDTVPVVENGLNRLLISATNSARWFRLKKRTGLEPPGDPASSLITARRKWEGRLPAR